MSLFLVACNAGTIDKQPGENGTDIIGGVVDTGDPSVVVLASLGGTCTGTVIAPTVVLTAAHCVLPELAGTAFAVYSGNDYNAQNGTSYDLVRVEWDHQFSLTNLEGGHDIGVAILKNPIPLRPLPYNKSSVITSMAGQPIRLVGYGNNDGAAATGAGLKRQATTTLNQVTDRLLSIGNTHISSCQGDSGGPAFMNINGVETLVGTSSYGPQGCVDASTDTRVDVYAAQIEAWSRGQPSGECKTEFVTGGAIADEYHALGGCSSFLGAPTTYESDTACEGGRYSGFANGAITWSPSVGAHETHGGIRAKWEALGFECGILGLPTSDESNAACGGGRYNNFERGAITWTSAAGAHETHGPIRDRWLALGYECQYLGFPTSDVYAFNGGSRCDFQGGSITVDAAGVVTDQHKACSTGAECKPAGGTCVNQLCQ